MIRHVCEADREQFYQNRLTIWGKKIYERRHETVEGSFADVKQLHGRRYARFKGISRVKAQCLLAAACHKMKKITRLPAVFLRLLVVYSHSETADKRHQRIRSLLIRIAVQSI